MRQEAVYDVLRVALWFALIARRVWTVDVMFATTTRIARAILARPGARVSSWSAAQVIEATGRPALARWWARLGGGCMERAVVARIGLALAGVDAEIVVGFRLRGAWEGHAWIATKEATSRVWLVDVGDHFREIRRW